VVPSKPGIFAIAEEIMNLSGSTDYVGTAAPGYPAEQSSAAESSSAPLNASTYREGPDFIRTEMAASSGPPPDASLLGDAALQRSEGTHAKRMLAVLQFSEDDDMAFTLDRMFTCINPMRARLASGRCFLRFVVIEDQDQRRSICSALNQWMLSSSEKASGLPGAFSSSVELTTAGAASAAPLGMDNSPAHLIPDSGAGKNLHCPQPLPSGF
jgi:hypothetical protein